MKLLLDEMWSPDIATQLRRRGHDVIAVAERADLRGQTDAAIFAVAQTEQRAVVTENVGDYRPLALIELQQNSTHFGLIFSTNARFPRHDPRTAGRMVVALHSLLTDERNSRDSEYWLS